MTQTVPQSQLHISGPNNHAINVVLAPDSQADRAGVVAIVSLANDALRMGDIAFHDYEGSKRPVVLAMEGVVMWSAAKTSANRQHYTIF